METSQRWFGTNTDITEQKRLEEKLMYIASFPEMNPNPIFEVDDAGAIKYSNPAANRLFPDLGILGRDHPILQGNMPDVYKKDGKGVHIREVRINDTYYHQSINYIPENKTIRFYSTDITERKQVEEALKDAKVRNELYVDLMGHDINNINQVAMGYLELAAESLNLNDGDKELIQKPLEALRNSVSLIENVQKLKRLKSGGLRAEIIDLNDVLLGLKDHYSHGIDKNIVINYTPKQDCRVMANGLLKDIFSNLIGNAIKHTPRKNVIINIMLNSAHEDGKKYYRGTVEDNGCGIPDDLKIKIFNRLERGNTKAHGKGLGLYLVKTLVDDFHGKVWVEDRIKGDHKQGSQFIVMLPAVEGVTGIAMPAPPRIGIVEDDVAILGLYKKILAKHGLRAEYTAINGIEAVEMARSANPKPDIILMDHRMPGMTGLEATREILKIAPKIKIIFASADASIEKDALKAGVYKFFHKPVIPKDLIKAINDLS